MSTLSKLSKIFEKPMYSQINTCMNDKFSKYLTRFRTNHKTQHVLLNMTANCSSNQNKGNKIRAVFMDLSKTIWTTPDYYLNLGHIISILYP